MASAMMSAQSGESLETQIGTYIGPSFKGCWVLFSLMDFGLFGFDRPDFTNKKDQLKLSSHIPTSYLTC